MNTRFTPTRLDASRVRQGADQLGFSARGDGPPPADAAASEAIASRAGSAYLGGPRRFAAYDPIGHLPATSAEKLRRLRAADQDVAAAISALTEARRAAQEQRRQALLRHQMLTDARIASSYGTEIIPPDQLASHPAATQARAQLAEAEGVIADCNERIGALRQRRWGGLRRIEDYVAALRPGSIEAHEPVEPPKVKGDIAAAVDALRNTIANHKADLHEVRSACLPSHIAREKVRAEIAALAERGAIDVMPVIEAGLPLRWPEIEVRGKIHGHVPTAEGAHPLVGFSTQPAVDVKAILAFLFGAAIVEKLDQEIAELSDDPNALSPEDRAAREAALNSQILACERAEERLIELAAAEGRTILRRADAGPVAVLGLR